MKKPDIHHLPVDPLMIEQLLAVKLEEMIKPGGSIGLKPNLVVGKPADSGPPIRKLWKELSPTYWQV